MIVLFWDNWIVVALWVLFSVPFLVVPRNYNGERGFIWFLAALMLSPPIAYFLLRDFSRPSTGD